MPDSTRRLRYSERSGLRPARLERQYRELDEATRTALWNAMVHTIEDCKRRGKSEYLFDAFRRLYTDHYEGKLGHDAEEDRREAFERFANDLSGEDWAETADALEAFYDALSDARDQSVPIMSQWGGPDRDTVAPMLAQQYEQRVNAVFERRQVDHRMRGGQVLDIGSGLEVEAIDAALDSASPYSTARHHLEEGLRALSDRDEPNPRQAIREAVNAVESAARTATGAKTLGAALPELKKRRPDLHPALVSGWDKLYGWTSDAGGIRHGNSELAEASPALARWMLVSAAGFLTYLETDHAPEADE